MESRKTHLINEKGDRKVVETRNAKKEIKRLNESTNTTYHIDVDWYWNNGYIIAEEGFKKIEGQLFDDGKDRKDKLTIEEAENLTIEKVRKIYEHNGKL